LVGNISPDGVAFHRACVDGRPPHTNDAPLAVTDDANPADDIRGTIADAPHVSSSKTLSPVEKSKSIRQAL
jgi:hypothetical protein